MCEVTRQNFTKLFPQIKQSLQKSKFIAIDLEFSALIQQQNQKYSFFDSPSERYSKLRSNVEQVVPLQIGLTAFSYNDQLNHYSGETFTFYVSPPSFLHLDKRFLFNASTLTFLSLHKFDFNKFAYSGIPFLNRREEDELRDILKTGDFWENESELNILLEDALDLINPSVRGWYEKSGIDDCYEVKQVAEVYDNFPEMKYGLHKVLRLRFRNMWTYEDDGKFFIKRVREEDFVQLSHSCHLDEEILDYLTGFRRVYKLLKQMRKSLVGHNLMQDLMILSNICEAPLPRCYEQFKKLVHEIFPAIYDTKSIFYELRKFIPKEREPNRRSGLEDLYIYFKDGSGRHLITNHIIIETNISAKDLGCYHDAGWDSYCAGYIFIRLGHFNVGRNYPKSKDVLYLEIIHHFSDLRNRINIIQGSTNYINFEGADPKSSRPPWLRILPAGKSDIDLNDLTACLSCYGRFSVRKLGRNQILVAFDNFRAFQDVLSDLGNTKKYQVHVYEPFHSPIVTKILIGSLTFSGGLVLWLLYKSVRNF